jgi:5'-deoxy-5'-methylthioadenosine phosphorylase
MLAIIGGTGLSRLSGFEELRRESVETPWSEQAVELEYFTAHGQSVVFLPRHGPGHSVPPHKINYRANIWALKESGIDEIIAINAVGGIHPQLPPGSFMVPDQIIDYSHSRDATFFEGNPGQVIHVDFTEPFTASLRDRLLEAVRTVSISSPESARPVLDGGVYGVTQGPRLETAAEIKRLQRDGCDIVGMTAMPEAGLARELDISYAMLALSVNWAAGLFPGEIAMAEIEAVVEGGMSYVVQVLQAMLKS